LKNKRRKTFQVTIAIRMNDTRGRDYPNKAPDSSSSRNVAEIDKSDMEVNKIYHTTPHQKWFITVMPDNFGFMSINQEMI